MNPSGHSSPQASPQGHMTKLRTRVNRGDETWISRSERNSALIQELRERIDAAMQGGSERAVSLHRERGKRLPRERIAEICDPGTPFLELSSLAADGLYVAEHIRQESSQG